MDPYRPHVSLYLTTRILFELGTARNAMKLIRLAITNQLTDIALNDRRVRVTLDQLSIPGDSRGVSRN
jgi:hypothetical protein